MTPDLMQMGLLFVSAALAGAINSVAGGGTFFTFPMLLFAGIPPIVANATSTMALWPGSIASAFAYRKDAIKHKSALPHLIIISFIGGIAGAVTLLLTPERTFKNLIPWLLLAATVLFAASPRITAFFRARVKGKEHLKKLGIAGTVCLQLVISFYGGYFGAGIGILMLAMLGLMGIEDIHEMNALKTILGSIINGLAVCTFIVAHVILWKIALLMLVGAVIGGFYGATLAKRMNPEHIRRFVIGCGFVLTAYFFWA